MRARLLGILDGLMRAYERWPRHAVIEASGEMVEILEVQDGDGQRRCRVETRDGRILELAESELGSRLAGQGVVAGIAAAMVALGAVVGAVGGLGGVESTLEDIAACAVVTLEKPAATP